MLDILIMIIGGMALICLWMILYDSNRFVIVSHKIVDKRIDRACRAVVLADLHNKCYGKENIRLLEAIDLHKPDFILVAGDMLTAKPGKNPDIALNFLRKISEKYPVYYGNGNHEHRLKLYPEQYGDMAKTYEKALKDMGIRLLVNAHMEVPDTGIVVYGAEIDKFYYKRFRVQHMEEDYLERILGKANKKKYTVLLAHNPDYFPKYAKWGADLVFSGHVHGGLVRIPFWGKGAVSPNVRLFPKYDGGLYRQDKSMMLLSRGLGVHTIPIRLFNPGELLVVDFDNSSPME